MREYQEFNAERRERIPAALWVFWAPEPDEVYRWRIQLDCGCTTEVLTHGMDVLPHERQWLDPVSLVRLPPGQLLCFHDDSEEAPYRDIVEWGDRREVSFPADPEEPPDGEDPDIWAVTRRDQPRTLAFWKVTLSCRHATEVCTDLHWLPEDGPHRVDNTRLQEMHTDFEEFWASEPDAQSERDRNHYKRLLDEGWPRPEPEAVCYRCTDARVITAYQRAGWLVPRKLEPATRPKPASRASVERRLRQAEAEAEQLRRQLAQLDDHDIDTRP